ncbi:CgeB family protein [Evansella tamaricis]|uniref:Glycosyltransferase n=1 Tax=Evansella tamaricis TaxID=2069301 RepID=A0ABS6JIC9_9BACI|nr:DUF3880 domain-containing protein [Evansella tamaricis]MBU9713298.1 glycosyltransferase [Evansella tamaricis]
MKLLYICSPYRGIYDYLNESLIDAWSSISGIDIIIANKDDPIEQIVSEKKPEIAFLLFGRGIKAEQNILKQLKKCRKVGWFCEDPYFIYDTKKYIHDFDLVFTVEKTAVSFYEALGHQNVHYMPLGYNPNVYYPKRTSDAKYKSDVCFVGYPYPNRINIINQIIRKTDWKVTVVGGKWSNFLRNWQNYSQLTCISHWIDPSETGYYYSNSSIVLNPHRPANQLRIINGISPNNRCFEIAACDAIQLCDNRKGLEELSESLNIITYKNMDDVIIQLDQWINSTRDKNKKYPMNQAEHTFLKRINKMINLIG